MGKPYRIKHRQTGLYLKPVTGSYNSKTNFSKKGKVYINATNMISHSIKQGDLTIKLYVSEKQYNKYKFVFDEYSNGIYEKLLFEVPLVDLEIEFL